MPNGTRVAAIDAGSNGLRMLIGEVEPDGSLEEIFYRRAAVRLGADAFSHGGFREETLKQAVEVFRAFRVQLDRHDVKHYRAIATSATRDSENGAELVQRVAEAAWIDLDIIDGLEEARLLRVAIAGQVELRGRTGLLIDMGGGSVEVTIVRDGRALAWESLPLGPVRLLAALTQQKKAERDARELLKPFEHAIEHLVTAELGDRMPALCVGTGGNIERLGKLREQMLQKKGSDTLIFDELQSLHDQLLDIPIAARMETLKLRADRADLIVIAAAVLLEIMRQVRAKTLLIPGVGIKEALLWEAARAVNRYVSAPNLVEFADTGNAIDADGK